MEVLNGLSKKCLFCGIEFRSTRERRNYCSKQCFDASVKQRQKSYTQNNKEAIYNRRTTCKYCNNKFKMEDLKERCCSNENCINKKIEEKARMAKRKYYNRHVKKTTNKFKKKDAENSRKYRKTHTEEINRRDSLRKKEKREWINTLKTGLNCLKCGEMRWFCLEFHHKNREDKKFGIGEAVGKGYGKESILEEIAKCVVLCSNCHSHLHYLERVNESWSPDDDWFTNKDKFE